MSTPRVSVISLCLALLLVCYTVLTILYPSSEVTELMSRVLTVVAITVATYYLGYSKCLHTLTRLNPTVIKHWVPKYIKRLGYIVLGFGIALIVQHVVLYGVDLDPTELILGHEFWGLYCVIVGMVLIGLSNKTEKVLTRT